MEGTVKKLTDRGYGFITREDSKKDLFFHANSLVNVKFDELKEGDKVKFEIENGRKGPAAVNVERI